MPSLDDPRVQRMFAGVAEATSLARFTERVLPPLGDLLGASIVVIHRKRPDGGCEGGPEPAYSEIMRAYAPYEVACPVARAKRMMRRRVAVTTELVSRPEYRRSPVVRDVFAPFEAEHQLAARLDAPELEGGAGTYLICARSRRQRAWSASHLALVEALLPTFSAAMVRNERWAAVEAAAEEAGPRVAFDADGELLWMSRGAADLFGAAPPLRLRAAARALATSDGGPIALSAGDGLPRGVTLRRDRDRRGSPRIVAMVDPASPEVAAARRFRLTRAETEVVRALGRGYSNAEIAGALGISRGTVRIHLSRIYGKLGVHSRTQALVKLRE